MSKTKWYTKAVYIAVALAFVFGMTPLVAAQPGDGGAGVVEPVNTLRVYGQCDEGAEFPYDEEDDPFNIAKGPDNGLPDKDFLVWNPAYMYHLDSESMGIPEGEPGSGFFQSIVVNGNNANEKVFLKQWYVPKYPEPRGKTWTTCSAVSAPDIVKEYTYLLLDTDNNPQFGRPKPELTTFVFPIADNDDAQIGLDSYDAVVDDGVLADKTVLNYIWPTGTAFPARTSANWVIDISTDTLTVGVGDIVQFLDHSAEIMSIGTDTIMVKVYYGGNDSDTVIATVPMDADDVLSAGRHATHVDDITWNTVSTYDYLAPIVEPWYLELIGSGGGAAFVRAGRLVEEEESFFVDAAEYDVASLWIHEWTTDEYELKYITLRNPLPKVDVNLEPLTIIKKAVGPCPELIPLLPPFNMEHDIIDDINIPEVVSQFDCDDNPISHADEQYPDNVDGWDEYCGLPTPYPSPAPQPDEGDDGYGDDSGISMDYNTIAGRRVEDQLPAEECWIAEEKEERFDTNLLEEKFTPDANEDWQWINIETLPWDYTEFVLPEIDDITGTGDFILVSSFLAPNSKRPNPSDDVRVKFVYDADYGPAEKTGLYVNTIGLEPVNNPPNVPSNPSPADAASDVAVNADLSWTGGDPDVGDTVTYDVYFDTTGATTLVSNDQSACTYDPGALSSDTKYYWKIVATDNHAASTTGPVWDFTTEVWSPCDYDTDTSGFVEIGELLDAIGDYIGGTITISQLLDVIDYYIGHTPC